VTHIASGKQFAWKKTEMLEGQEYKVKEEARIAQELHSPLIIPIVDFLCG
jgi:hypothetical protein